MCLSHSDTFSNSVVSVQLRGLSVSFALKQPRCHIWEGEIGQEEEGGYPKDNLNQCDPSRPMPVLLIDPVVRGAQREKGHHLEIWTVGCHPGGQPHAGNTEAGEEPGGQSSEPAHQRENDRADRAPRWEPWKPRHIYPRGFSSSGTVSMWGQTTALILPRFACSSHPAKSRFSLFLNATRSLSR